MDAGVDPGADSSSRSPSVIEDEEEPQEKELPQTRQEDPPSQEASPSMRKAPSPIHATAKSPPRPPHKKTRRGTSPVPSNAPWSATLQVAA